MTLEQDRYSEREVQLESFYKAWKYLSAHPIFRENSRLEPKFLNALRIDVVKINPTTNRIDRIAKKNTKIQVWLQTGPYEAYDGYASDVIAENPNDQYYLDGL